MRKIEMDVFKFEELSPKAKQKAIEKYGDWDYCDVLTDIFQEALKAKGYDYCKVEWSLGCCQGDGVAFYGSVDVRTWWKKSGRTLFDKAQKKKLYEEWGKNTDLNISIKRNSYGHHYSHYNTMYVEVEWDNEELVKLLEEEVLRDIQYISKDLERKGYKDIEYYTSEECFQETAEANEYEFFADGTLV
jgi:hypothetical protein